MEPKPSTTEDYVHIENPNPNPKPMPNPNADQTEALSDSIVNVADELRREENEGLDDQNSVVLGDDVANNDDENNSNSRSSSGNGGGRGAELPEELSRNVSVLTCESSVGGTCYVYLVGTAHVSVESCKEVEAVVSYLKPEAVFLELCASRVAILAPRSLKVPTMGEMIEMWKKKHNMFGILYSWFLAKVANQLEVLPGSEFRIAYEEAKKYGGKVLLGDRPVQITLQRTWRKMPLWHKTKLIFSLFFQALFLPSPEELNKMLKEMDNVDMLTLVIQEMSKHFPTLMETLVDERDQYMSSTLLALASEHTSVVAVVGKGHLQGIQKHWMQPVEMRDLLEVPAKKSVVSAVKVLTTIGVTVVGVAIVSGLYVARKK